MPRLIGRGFLAVLSVVGVLASGSQAHASHVQCGDVVMQNTTLDSDLVDCPGDGIVIGAGDITLDLGGHTVDGSADRPEAGIGNDGHDGVSILNGRVQGFRDGIQLIEALHNHVRRVAAVDNYYGIVLVRSEQNLIERNLAAEGSHWIGIRLSDSHSNAIERNVISRLGGGIEVVGSSGNRIVGNQLEGTGQGMYIAGPAGRSSTGNLISGNSITEHGPWGIHLGGANNRVERNRISGSGTNPHVPSYGIYAVSTENSRIEQNSVTRTETAIFCLWSPYGNVIAGNRLHATARGILSLSCDGMRIARNRAIEAGTLVTVASSVNVYVGRNLSRDNWHGITFFEDVSDSRIEGNSVLNSREEGIDATGSRNRIVGNRVANSGYRGIMVRGDNDYVEGNVVSASGLVGIRATGMGHRIERNAIRDSGQTGLLVISAGPTQVLENLITGSAESGIAVGGSDSSIIGNAVFASGADGISVHELAVRTLVGSNRTHRNADDGIDVEAGLATVMQNTANRNGDLGIEAASDVVDGGRNRAASNGNPLQCVNVFCK